MKIKPFAVEEWMNEYEVGARFNIAETCVDSVSLDELFALTGEDKARFLADFSARRLTYGDIVGSDDLRGGICGLYKTVHPEEIRGKRFLLIDDVLTTGSTLAECARVLREAGAADVLCLTLAMTRGKK